MLGGTGHGVCCSFSRGVQVHEEACAIVTVASVHHLSRSVILVILLFCCSSKRMCCVFSCMCIFSSTLLTSEIENKQVKVLRLLLIKISCGNLELIHNAQQQRCLGQAPGSVSSFSHPVNNVGLSLTSCMAVRPVRCEAVGTQEEETGNEILPGE